MTTGIASYDRPRVPEAARMSNSLRFSPEVKADMRTGAILRFEPGARFGIRKLKRAWFNPATGHYVIDAGIFLWSEEGCVPWRTVIARAFLAQRTRRRNDVAVR